MSMKVKKKLKSSIKIKKARLFSITKIALFIAFIFCTVELISTNIELTEKSKQYDQLHEQKIKIDDENGEIKRFVEDDLLQEYSERLARDKLNYAYPDEKVYYIVPSN